MAEFPYPTFDIMDYSLIMPVPLHTRRLRQRGFNQAVILAREISRRFSIALDFSNLKRVVFTESQARLGREEREINVKAAFAVAEPEKITGQKIVLVDDVLTTGSTVEECARALLKHKAEQVAVLTLARAV
jgi:ComF family protein